MPDATTLWLFREKLTKAGLLEKLFNRFGTYLKEQGYEAKEGKIIDATIVPAPRQRNSREENKEIKVPENWKEQKLGK